MLKKHAFLHKSISWRGTTTQTGMYLIIDRSSCQEIKSKSLSKFWKISPLSSWYFSRYHSTSLALEVWNTSSILIIVLILTKAWNFCHQVSWDKQQDQLPKTSMSLNHCINSSLVWEHEYLSLIIRFVCQLCFRNKFCLKMRFHVFTIKSYKSNMENVLSKINTA